MAKASSPRKGAPSKKRLAPKSTKPKRQAKPLGRPVEYTLEYVRAEAAALLEFLATEENADKLFLEDFIMTRSYAPQRWSEWRKKYADDAEFIEMTARATMILELRLKYAGLNARNPAMPIFLLANNHGYARTDAGQQKHTPDETPREGVQIYLPSNGREKA